MSMKNDPKNSWSGNMYDYQQAQKLKKYNTKKDNILQTISLIGVIDIFTWIIIVFITRKFMMWHLFMVGIGLLFISFPIINNLSLIPRIKKFSSREDLILGYGNVKCCYMIK